jgi:hypothetical protein
MAEDTLFPSTHGTTTKKATRWAIRLHTFQKIFRNLTVDHLHLDILTQNANSA